MIEADKVIGADLCRDRFRRGRFIGVHVISHTPHLGRASGQHVLGNIDEEVGAEAQRLDVDAFVVAVKALAERRRVELGAEKVILPFDCPRIVESVDALGAAITRQSRVEELELFTVHLMGTARMGSTPESAVVDPSGEVWDLPGCYVADASLFPSAIGVNPQLTIMALATRIAWRLGSKRAAA